MLAKRSFGLSDKLCIDPKAVKAHNLFAFRSLVPPGFFRSFSMRLLLVCTILVSALPYAGEAHTAANDNASLGYTRPDWMGQLPDYTPLSELSVPGTHDTMAYDGTILGFGQTQSVSLNGQLKGGIRALDIRCRHLNNRFPIHHGSFYLNANFTDVMDDCAAFLETHPTESIFMKIAKEYDEEGNTRTFQATLMDYLDNYPPELIWKTNDWTRLPSLGEVRGKIVIIDSFPTEDPQCGYLWGPTFDNADPDLVQGTGICDSYNDQWTAIKNHLVKANEESPSSNGFATV